MRRFKSFSESSPPFVCFRAAAFPPRHLFQRQAASPENSRLGPLDVTGTRSQRREPLSAAAFPPRLCSHSGCCNDRAPPLRIYRTKTSDIERQVARPENNFTTCCLPSMKTNRSTGTSSQRRPGRPKTTWPESQQDERMDRIKAIGERKGQSVATYRSDGDKILNKRADQTPAPTLASHNEPGRNLSRT